MSDRKSLHPTALEIHQRLCRQRAGAAVAALIGAPVIAWLIIACVGFLSKFPDPVEFQFGFLMWQENWSGVRLTMREVTLEIGAAILGLVAMISLAQVPARGSDLENYAYRTVGQFVTMISILCMALYGWLSLPVTSSEWTEFHELLVSDNPAGKESLVAAAPFGLLLIFGATGLAAITAGGDAIQGAKSVKFLLLRGDELVERLKILDPQGRGEKRKTLWVMLMMKGLVETRDKELIERAGPVALCHLNGARLLALWPVGALSVAWLLWNVGWLLGTQSLSSGRVLGLVVVAAFLWAFTALMHFGWRYMVYDSPQPSGWYKSMLFTFSWLVTLLIWTLALTAGVQEEFAWWVNVFVVVTSQVLYALLGAGWIWRKETGEFERRRKFRMLSQVVQKIDEILGQESLYAGSSLIQEEDRSKWEDLQKDWEELSRASLQARN